MSTFRDALMTDQHVLFEHSSSATSSKRMVLHLEGHTLAQPAKHVSIGSDEPYQAISLEPLAPNCNKLRLPHPLDGRRCQSESCKPPVTTDWRRRHKLSYSTGPRSETSATPPHCARPLLVRQLASSTAYVRCQYLGFLVYEHFIRGIESTATSSAVECYR